jgi:hypothetical protein
MLPSLGREIFSTSALATVGPLFAVCCARRMLAADCKTSMSGCPVTNRNLLRWTTPRRELECDANFS